MAIRGRAVLFSLAFLFIGGTAVFSQDTSLEDSVQQLQKRMEALEKKVAEQDVYIKSQNATIQSQQEKISKYEGKLSEIDDQLHRQNPAETLIGSGFEIGAGATMVIQGTNNTNGGDNTLKDSRADGSYSADITFEKEFKEIAGKAFVHVEAGEGSGLEDDLVLYSNVNRDAGDSDNSVEVTEAWYEQELFAEKVFLTFGKLDPTAYFDNNEAANDETTQFLGRVFCNSPTIEFPDNNAGLRLSYVPVEWLELGYGAFNSRSDWDKIGDNLFNIWQVAFKTSFFGLPGNYRFLGWDSNVYHTEWLDKANEKEGAYGFGLSFDQKFADAATAFCRYGWQDPSVYNPNIMTTGDYNFSLEQAWNAGLQLEGKPWGREKDVLAFAVGQVFPSHDYKEVGTSPIPTPNAKAEGHLETYYRIFMNDHLSISPDFQYVWNPFGKDVAEDESPIFIYGIRTQVDF